jgi:hypothetical protein
MHGILALALAGTVLLLFGQAFAFDPRDPGVASKDDDRDGLTNLGEFVHGTDPLNPDTDGDGLPDGWEVYYDEHRASWPVTSLLHDKYARYDSDGDGALDVNVDPDYRFDPTNNITARQKPDTDGWDNLMEYRQGTDPTNPDTDGDNWTDDVDPQPLIPMAWDEMSYNCGTIHVTSGQRIMPEIFQGADLTASFAISWEFFEMVENRV